MSLALYINYSNALKYYIYVHIFPPYKKKFMSVNYKKDISLKINKIFIFIYKLKKKENIKQ